MNLLWLGAHCATLLLPSSAQPSVVNLPSVYSPASPNARCRALVLLMVGMLAVLCYRIKNIPTYLSFNLDVFPVPYTGIFIRIQNILLCRASEQRIGAWKLY